MMQLRRELWKILLMYWVNKWRRPGVPLPHLHHPGMRPIRVANLVANSFKMYREELTHLTDKMSGPE